MLVKMNRLEFEQYIDSAYKLSLDLSKSAFPIYADTIKTKADFVRNIIASFDDNNSEMLLFKHNNEVCGFISYYILADDNYIGIRLFNINSFFAEAMSQFTQYLSSKYRGYSLYLGFPTDNTEAKTFFNSVDVSVADTSSVYVVHFDGYKPLKEDVNIVEVNKSNYNCFRKLHDNTEGIYWNSDRLYDGLIGSTKNPWLIYILKEDSDVLGGIYFTYYKEMAEIFGIDFKDGVFDFSIAKKLIIKAFNKSKLDSMKALTYFASKEEIEIMRDLDMSYIY